MRDLTRITVDLGDRSYPILIGHRVIDRLSDLLQQVAKPRKAAVVFPNHFKADEGTAKYVTQVRVALKSALCETIEIPVGVGREQEPSERRKSWEDLQHVVESLLAFSVDRQSCVVALGGGVIGDLVGLAAAITLRGIPLIQVPTTLLAMVDASVGGKTAINSASHGKNLIGVFWQPKLVLADLDTLRTLPRREVAAGMAEAIKHGVIADAGFFEMLERSQNLEHPDDSLLTLAVKRSCEIKAKIVAEDERESGKRMNLNFGHTVGHALENSIGHYTVPHGEWVAIGMVAAAEIAAAMEMVDRRLPERIATVCRAAGLPTHLEEIPEANEPDSPVKAVAWERLLEIMRHDKKTHGDQLRFILPTRLGEVTMRDDVPLDAVERACRNRGALVQ